MDAPREGTDPRVESAERRLSWIRWGRNVAAFCVALGVAGEFAVHRATRSLHGTIEAARELQLADLAARAAEANERAQTAQLEQEKLKASNLALLKAVRPRRIAVGVPKEKGDELRRIGAAKKKAAGTLVLIQVVPDDFEASMLANDIAFVLSHDDWRVRMVTTEETGVPPVLVGFGSGLSGISIVTWEQRETPLCCDPESTPQARAWAAGEALSEYLGLTGLDAPHFTVDPFTGTEEDETGMLVPQQFRPPPDAVAVFVGAKPLWMLPTGAE